MRFDPPPGWPRPPEGWTPPAGWAPDPSWPAPPPGWVFWVPVPVVSIPAYDGAVVQALAPVTQPDASVADEAQAVASRIAAHRSVLAALAAESIRARAEASAQLVQ